MQIDQRVRCSKVVATELAKVSVAAAEHNMAANGIANVHVGRLSSEEFVQAWRGDRIFARMQVSAAVLCQLFQS